MQPALGDPTEPADDQGNITTRATYRLFIVFVTALALVVMVAYYLPLPEPVRQVLYIQNSINAFILLYDFFMQFYYVPKKLRYMVTFGWLDFSR